MSLRLLIAHDTSAGHAKLGGGQKHTACKRIQNLGRSHLSVTTELNFVLMILGMGSRPKPAWWTWSPSKGLLVGFYRYFLPLTPHTFCRHTRYHSLSLYFIIIRNSPVILVFRWFLPHNSHTSVNACEFFFTVTFISTSSSSDWQFFCIGFCMRIGMVR